MVQVADGSVAPAPPPGAGIEVVAASAGHALVDDSVATDGPQSPGKKLLRTVVTRARRSGLRLALIIIFVFGLASLVLTARSTSFSRVWRHSISGAGGAGLQRSATRTVVPVLVRHRDDDERSSDSSTDRRTDPNELRAAASPPVVRYALLRVIGNALPPRHDPARTLQNLRFILEHEELTDAAELTRHWVLHRILDVDVLAQLKALLREFDAPFTEIPFDLAAYAQCPYRVVIEDEGVDRVHALPATATDADATPRKGAWGTVQEVSEILDAKNRYALGVNAARNVMLTLGQALGARWILPWDQNAFLRDEAWRRIKTDLTYQDRLSLSPHAPHALKYFLVPMDRLTQENDVVLTPAYRANPWEEPQLIFRADATERFDERFRYGKRDKVSLLVRLRVPGIWTQWGWSAWERKRTFDNISSDIDGVSVPQTGYAVRLYSGIPGLEAEDQAAAYWRELKRGEGVISVLHSLEARVMRDLFAFSSAHWRVYNTHALSTMQALYRTKGSRGPLRQLTQDATDALVTHSRQRWSVTRNTPLGPFNHSNFFANYVDAPTTQDDAQLIRDMAYNVTALALAWQVTGESRFADSALSALDLWCANESSAMEPVLDFADLSRAGFDAGDTASWVGAASGIRHTAVLPILLDAMRMLFSAPVATATAEATVTASPEPLALPVKTRVVAWVERLYHYVRTSAHALTKYRAAPSLYGLQYDLQVAAMAAFLNDSQTFRYTLGTLQGRLVTMVDAHGQLLPPLNVAQDAYELLSLATWGQALDAAQQLNMTTHLLQFDLTPDRKEETVSAAGGLLCRLVAAHIPCCQDPLARAARDGIGSPLEPEGACVTLLQTASPVQLFIYQRLVRHALPVCVALQSLASCTSLAEVAVTLEELPTDELRRFQLAPYPHLLR